MCRIGERTLIDDPPQVTDFKPVPLKAGEDEDYMLALKQEIRGAMQQLPHNIKSHSKRAGEEMSCIRNLIS